MATYLCAYVNNVLIKCKLLITIEPQRGHGVGGRRGGTLGSWMDIVVDDHIHCINVYNS